MENSKIVENNESIQAQWQNDIFGKDEENDTHSNCEVGMKDSETNCPICGAVIDIIDTYCFNCGF